MTWNNGMPMAADTPGGPGSGAELMPLMDELAHGLAVVGPDGRLRHANQSARVELQSGRALGLRADHLYACASEGVRVLQLALEKAATGRRSLISLPALAGRPLTLAVVPLRAATPAHAGIGLLFSRASVCDSLMLCFFARSHGLTSAEETVLGLLCQGLAAPEVAVHLKVAVSTVRSHVRSLCAKTRASGVRDLVSRVALLPPVVAALPGTQVH